MTHRLDYTQNDIPGSHGTVVFTKDGLSGAFKIAARIGDHASQQPLLYVAREWYKGNEKPLMDYIDQRPDEVLETPEGFSKPEPMVA